MAKVIAVLYPDPVDGYLLSRSLRATREDLREIISVYQKCGAEAVRPFGDRRNKSSCDGSPTKQQQLVVSCCRVISYASITADSSRNSKSP
jgi:hypothetical protein